MKEITSARLLVRGLSMGFTCKDATRPHLNLREFAGLVRNFATLGFTYDEIEIRFYDWSDRQIPADWWIATHRDGSTYVDYYRLDQDDVSEMEDGTTDYINSRGW